MAKKTLILIFLLLIIFILIIYLILTSGSVNKIDNSGQQTKNKIVALSEDAYKIKFKEIFTAYEKLALDSNLTVEKIAELKNKSLAIKGLPAKFKDLHLIFVQALDKFENYLKQADQTEEIAGQQLISQLKIDYSWLNN